MIDKQIIIELHKNEMMWFLLGSCISADSNMTNEERTENIDSLKDILKTLKDPEVVEAIDERSLKKYASYCRKGAKMLKREIEEETNKQ